MDCMICGKEATHFLGNEVQILFAYCKDHYPQHLKLDEPKAKSSVDCRVIQQIFEHKGDIKMLVEKKETLVELVNKAMPYSNQIGQWDFSENDAVRFVWRGNKFRVSQNLGVETVGNGVLIGSDISILLEKLIKLAWYDYDKLKFAV